jgi:uncharacterized protein YndB with AHSA1/START domain
MPAISDIIIKKPISRVWSTIADAATHGHWLGRDCVTTYQGDGELVEGMKFTRFDRGKGLTIEGEVVALRPGTFLKVRVDASADHFVTTEYHLISIAEGCVLRVLVEIYDTGEAQHSYFPEVIEHEWQSNLKRLRSYCEAA